MGIETRYLVGYKAGTDDIILRVDRLNPLEGQSLRRDFRPGCGIREITAEEAAYYAPPTMIEGLIPEPGKALCFQTLIPAAEAKERGLVP